MTKEIITTVKLIASENMILTNGQVYGAVVFLSDGQSEYDFIEITQEEYDQILQETLLKDNVEINNFTQDI